MTLLSLTKVQLECTRQDWRFTNKKKLATGDGHCPQDIVCIGTSEKFNLSSAL